MAEKITEESGVHKAWMEEAKKVKTLSQLMEFHVHLTEDYDHDYGTIVHAIAAAMMASFSVMNESKQGGITGFQASCLGWEMIEKFMGKMPMGGRLQNYNDLMYPQLSYRFNSITSETASKIKDGAISHLKEGGTAHPDVIAHWKKLAEGEIPFGLIVKED
jgi:hypothetical protein